MNSFIPSFDQLESKKLTIGVTGFTGFVGKRLMEYDASVYNLIPLDLRHSAINSLNLAGIDSIVHLAGKAHQMEPIADEIYFKVNCELAFQLARSARDQGVKQFIYISSTKVYSDETDAILNEDSVCLPSDPYGASKRKAEELLLTLHSPGFSVAIIRPPLIYGPEVKGNMLKLLHLAKSNYPLPLGKTGNLRSMVFVDNLIELINMVIMQEASGIFLAGDRKPLSTDEIVSMIRTEMHKSRRLIALPVIFRSILKILRPALYLRLFGSFVVDTTKTNLQLRFVPPYSTEEGIRKMVNWYAPNI